MPSMLAAGVQPHDEYRRADLPFGQPAAGLRPLARAEVRDRSNPEERAERTSLRGKVTAIQYADHVFPLAAPDERDLDTKPDSSDDHSEELTWIQEHTYAFFPNAPDAPVFTGQVITGERARHLHVRLFGSRR